MRVSFDAGRLNERGVAVAMFDYAFHARALVGVEPVILHNVRVPPEPEHAARFERVFPTYGYTTDDEMQRLIERERIDAAYFLKTGRTTFAFRNPAALRSMRCSNSSPRKAMPTPIFRAGLPRR